MGLFTKRPAARNANLAAHRVALMPQKEQHDILNITSVVAYRKFRLNISDLFVFPTLDSPVVFMNVVVHALGEIGVQPAIAGARWFWIKNPLTDCIGSGAILHEDQEAMFREHLIYPPTDIIEWTSFAMAYRERDFAAELHELENRWESGDFEMFADYLRERDALIEDRTKAKHGIS